MKAIPVIVLVGFLLVHAHAKDRIIHGVAIAELTECVSDERSAFHNLALLQRAQLYRDRIGEVRLWEVPSVALTRVFTRLDHPQWCEEIAIPEVTARLDQ